MCNQMNKDASQYNPMPMMIRRISLLMTVPVFPI